MSSRGKAFSRTNALFAVALPRPPLQLPDSRLEVAVAVCCSAQRQSKWLRCAPLPVQRSTWLMAWPLLVNTRVDPSLGHNGAAAPSQPDTKATATSSGCSSNPTTSRCHILFRCRRPALICCNGRCCCPVRVSQVVTSSLCRYFIIHTRRLTELYDAVGGVAQNSDFPRCRQFICTYSSTAARSIRAVTLSSEVFL